MPARARIVTVLAAVALSAVLAPSATAAPVTASPRVTMSDGVTLQATVTGEGALDPRPVIVEFSPYGRNSQTVDPGPDYTLVLVQIRGTGDSDGRFDALGPRTQADVVETLEWACHQPWSDGRIGLNGFSASAITLYNAMHAHLPCVKAAVLRSGTFELYRDLLYPGAINNIVPGAGVISLIGAPALAQGADRLARDPASSLDTATGLISAGLSDLEHPTQDAWWRERGFRGTADHLPILMIDGFFDVESRGAFEAYQALKDDGAQLLVTGAHDGSPKGTDGAVPQTRAWFDRHVRGVTPSTPAGARVQLLLSQGDREDYLNGAFERYDATDWPVPGTRWTSLALDEAHSAVALSTNDGSLKLAPRALPANRVYAVLPSIPLATDPPNAGIVGSAGLNALTAPLPLLTDMTLSGALGLSYTSAALKSDVLSAGPVALDVWLSSTVPQTNIWAVLSDVSPDRVPHPLTAGRLNSDFPEIDDARSRRDPVSGDIVQPYGRFDTRVPARVGQQRRYRVELWPIGNRFRAGHRLRLDIVGSSAASLPSLPALNTVRTGGPDASRLLVPVLPGSDLRAALGG